MQVLSSPKLSPEELLDTWTCLLQTKTMRLIRLQHDRLFLKFLKAVQKYKETSDPAYFNEALAIKESLEKIETFTCEKSMFSCIKEKMNNGKNGKFPLAIDESVITRSQHLIARDLENKLLNQLSNLVAKTRGIIKDRLHYHSDVLPVISCFTTIYNSSEKEKKDALRKYMDTALNSLLELKQEIDQMEKSIQETVALLAQFPVPSSVDLLGSEELKNIWDTKPTS